MKPVFQSKLYCSDAIHNGNCMAACLASLLELPLWMVPPFEDMFGRTEWRSRVDEWLRRFFGVYLGRIDLDEPEDMESLPEFYIANGMSARKVQHSVIFSKGMLVHDPHPSQSGIEAVSWIWVLEPVEKSV